MDEHINFTKINQDVDGNPRYVCHYSNLLTEQEKQSDLSIWATSYGVSERYSRAIERANKIGGRKYHTKSYGGGIVFQSYSLRELENSIREIVEKESK
jgi:hypothetical protein